MIKFIVTRGLGFAGAANYIPTMGFTAGEAAEVFADHFSIRGIYDAAIFVRGRYDVTINLRGVA